MGIVPLHHWLVVGKAVAAQSSCLITTTVGPAFKIADIAAHLLIFLLSFGEFFLQNITFSTIVRSSYEDVTISFAPFPEGGHCNLFNDISTVIQSIVNHFTCKCLTNFNCGTGSSLQAHACKFTAFTSAIPIKNANCLVGHHLVLQV